MIKQKFLQVLLWIRDHLHFLVEVVIRLSLGIEKTEINPNSKEGENSNDE